MGGLEPPALFYPDLPWLLVAISVMSCHACLPNVSFTWESKSTRERYNPGAEAWDQSPLQSFTQLARNFLYLASI